MDGVRSRYASGIKYARNPGEFLTYLGLILLVAGSFLSSYKFYRGLIVTIKNDISGITSSVSIRSMKCKNIFSLEKEVDEMVGKLNQMMEGL